VAQRGVGGKSGVCVIDAKLFSPQTGSMTADLRRVVFVIFPGCQSLDLSGPFEVFASANQVPLGVAAPTHRYQLQVAALQSGPVASESGLCVSADVALRSLRGSIDTLVVVGGTGSRVASQDNDLLHEVRRLATRSRRVASVCTGTFVLAAAGLIDGKTVCTHWARAESFERRFPRVRVDRDALFRRDDNVWTSAGVTAGIDLALALVEEDHGAELAQTIARWLVMFLRRPGGQSQFAAPVWHEAAERDAIRIVQDDVVAHPAHDHRVSTMAQRAAMSERHFLRTFQQEVGATPAKYVEAVRFDQASRLLESTDRTVERIATEVGFGTSETMRRVFLRVAGVSPTDYRRRFSLRAS
jgi:transcriptional regulator GlxA family with amidase domain